MARRNRRRTDDVRPLAAGFTNRRRDGEYIVQSLTGNASGKTYICPGCNQAVAAQVAHVVVWSEYQGPEARRHWHTPCWNRESRRRR